MGTRKGRTAYDELADRIRGLVREEARVASPPVERWMVTSSDPLIVEQVGGDIVIEEGDPDVEIDRAVLDDRPDVDDLVRVHSDGEGEGKGWIVAGVIA